MNYRDLVILTPNGSSKWTNSRAIWKSASLEDVAQALVHKLFETGSGNISPPDIQHHPLVQFLCESIGTNGVALTNAGFGLSLGFIASPYFSAVPKRPLSDDFLHRTAGELLAAASPAAALARLRAEFLHTQRQITTLKGTRISVFVISAAATIGAGILAHEPISFSSLTSTLLGISAYMVAGLASFRARTRQENAFRHAHEICTPFMIQRWRAAALESKFRYMRICLSFDEGRSTQTATFAVSQNNSAVIAETIDRAETSALANRARRPIYQVEAAPLNTEVGTTTVTLTVAAPSNRRPNQPSPPDTRGNGPRNGSRSRRPRFIPPLEPVPLFFSPPPI